MVITCTGTTFIRVREIFAGFVNISRREQLSSTVYYFQYNNLYILIAKISHPELVCLLLIEK